MVGNGNEIKKSNKMKTIVLGDIHGRTCWYDIIEKEQPDRIIFMGDYVSTHDKNISAEQQCSNLEDILNFKEGFGDNCILLRGNHDMQHLGYSWAECSGFFPTVYQWASSIKSKFLKLTQWVYIQDDLVFSHAGIGKEFWSYLNIGEPTKENILKINEIEPSTIFAFTSNRLSDYYGESTCQPLTWIRPGTLLQVAIEGWNQVVGHTRLDRPGNIVTNDLKAKYNLSLNELWCVDALPYWYMVIEDGKKEMYKLE